MVDCTHWQYIQVKFWLLNIHSDLNLRNKFTKNCKPLYFYLPTWTFFAPPYIFLGLA